MRSKIIKKELKKEDKGFLTFYLEFENKENGYYICTEKYKDYFKEGEEYNFIIERATGKKGIYNKVKRDDFDKEKIAGVGVSYAKDLLVAKVIDKNVLKETAIWFAKTIIEVADEL